eukprot:gene13179-biopygen21541
MHRQQEVPRGWLSFATPLSNEVETVSLPWVGQTLPQVTGGGQPCWLDVVRNYNLASRHLPVCGGAVTLAGRRAVCSTNDCVQE